MNADDHLLSQLTDRVQGRARSPRRGRRRLALLLVPIAVAGSVGVAPALRPDSPDTKRQARSLVVRAAQATAELPVCRYAGRDRTSRFVEGAVPEEVTRALPVLTARTRALPAADDPRLRRLGPGQLVVRRSFVAAAFPGGLRAVAAVTQGDGRGRLVDPQACRAAREDHVRHARPVADDPVRRRALALLQQERDTRPGSQSFSLSRWRASEGGSSASGISLVAGRPLPTGVLGHDGTVYSGLADPRTVRITATARASGEQLVSMRPRSGLFSVRLPPRTGPVVLRHLDGRGKVLRRETVRERR